MTTSTSRSEHLLWIASAIHTHGIAVLTVGSGHCREPGCGCEPEAVTWSYTIGFAERGLPELVTFGLSLNDGTIVSNWVRERELTGAPFEAGDSVTFQGVDARFESVPASWVLSDEDPIGSWFSHYEPGRPDLRPPQAIQFVWADQHGRFPGEPGCDAAVGAVQPSGARLVSRWWASRPESAAMLARTKRLRRRHRFH